MKSESSIRLRPQNIWNDWCREVRSFPSIHPIGNVCFGVKSLHMNCTTLNTPQVILQITYLGRYTIGPLCKMSIKSIKFLLQDIKSLFKICYFHYYYSYRGMQIKFWQTMKAIFCSIAQAASNYLHSTFFQVVGCGSPTSHHVVNSSLVLTARISPGRPLYRHCLQL